MPTFIRLYRTHKIRYLEKLYQNLTSSFQLIDNFLPRSKIKVKWLNVIKV